MAISVKEYEKARTSLVCSISISKPPAFNFFIAFSGDILFIASFSIGHLLSVEKQSNSVMRAVTSPTFCCSLLEPLEPYSD